MGKSVVHDQGDGKNHAFRKQQGKTQEELANLMNVSFQAISKRENGVTLLGSQPTLPPAHVG